MQYLLNKNHNVVNAGGTIMIKVNLQNIAVNNMLTGQNTLDSIFIDGNSILFITKPEYLKQLYRDEIRARSIKMNLKIAREEIHKRT